LSAIGRGGGLTVGKGRREGIQGIPLGEKEKRESRVLLNSLSESRMNKREDLVEKKKKLL